jgi:hypothetical protein
MDRRSAICQMEILQSIAKLRIGGSAANVTRLLHRRALCAPGQRGVPPALLAKMRDSGEGPLIATDALVGAGALVYAFVESRTRRSSPPIGTIRSTVPGFGFGPFQNGSRKNSTALRTVPSIVSASTLVAYSPRRRGCKRS